MTQNGLQPIRQGHGVRILHSREVVHIEPDRQRFHAPKRQIFDVFKDLRKRGGMVEVVEMGGKSIKVTGTVPAGQVFVDGTGVGDVGNVVLRDRKHLSQDGLIIVVIGVSKETGRVTSGPELISRGFVYVRENEELIAGVRNVAMGVLSRYETITQSDWTAIKNGIKDEMHDYLYGLIKRNPMILPIIMET